MKTIALAVLLFFSVILFGCVQNPPAEQQQTPGTGEVLQSETSDLNTGLQDISDLQNSLDDSSLDDSGIDENSFS